MRKPDFFIVGAPRCGTTAMNEYLKRHPEIFISNRKEIHFFDTDIEHAVRLTEEEYLRLFTPAREEKRLGEASVWYLYSHVAAERIKAFNRDARVIILLRNPVDMVYSLHSRLMFHCNEDVEDFETAFALSTERRQGRHVPEHCTIDPRCLVYEDIGRFSAQVKRYHDVLGVDRVHVVIYDDFRADTPGSYRRILEFLNVDPIFTTDFKIINKHVQPRSRHLQILSDVQSSLAYNLIESWSGVLFGQKGKLSKLIWKINRKPGNRPKLRPDIRAHVMDLFREDIHRLCDLLDRDLASLWIDA